MLDDIMHLYSESPTNGKTKCIIAANNPYKIMWDILVLFLVILVSIIVPIRLAFDTSEPIGWVIFYTLTDIIFLVDIILTFFTSVSNKQSVYEVTDKREIAKIYLKGWFLIDFISILPLDILIFQ